LIFTKPCIALALALGRNALSGALQGGDPGNAGQQLGAGLSGMLIAAVLMLLAMFSPFVLLKLLPIAEAAVVAGGVSRAPARGAQAMVQTGTTMRMLVGGHTTAGAGPTTASSSVAPDGGSAAAASTADAGGATATGAAAAAPMLVAKAGWDRTRQGAQAASDRAPASDRHDRAGQGADGEAGR
jgi:hypothetical protein